MTTKRNGKKTARKSAVSGKKKPERRTPAPVNTSPERKKTDSRVAPPSRALHALPHAIAAPHTPFSREIPTMYNETYIRVMPRDARHLFLHWELSPAAIKNAAKAALGDSRSPAPHVRVYEVRHAGTAQEERRPAGDFPLEQLGGSRYISMSAPGQTCLAELGFMAQSGEFVSVCSSDTVSCPPGRIQKGETQSEIAADTEALITLSIRNTTLTTFDAGSTPDIVSRDAIDCSLYAQGGSPVGPLAGPAGNTTPLP
jgi:hypothetical protein